MAETESGAERTEEPTGKRQEEAKRDGRVPRSQELSSAVILLAGTAALALAGGRALAVQAVRLFRQDAGWLSTDPIALPSATTMLRSVLQSSLLALVPFALAVISINLAINLVQARGVLSLEPVRPKLSNLSPLKGLKRVFGLDGLVNLIKAVLKVSVLGLVTYTTLRHALPEVFGLSGTTPQAVLALMRALTIKVAVWTGLAFLALAGVDYAWNLWRHHKSLMMTRQEVLQEHKETDGNPLIKSRIRSLQRALARRRMLTKVTGADVVITNPTHIAVALKYDPTLASAPIVLAMGERKLAERIKQIARGAGVPLVENKPLARALLATAKVGQAIPPALYVAVAEIIAFVYRQGGKIPTGLRREARS